MGNASGQGEHLPGLEVVEVIADPDRDLAVEQDELLVFSLVDVQGQAVTVRLHGLPDPEAPLAV